MLETHGCMRLRLRTSIIFLWFIIFIFLGGCNNKQQKFEVGTIKDFQIYKINGKNVTLGLEIPVNNQRKLNVKITNINLKAELNDSYLGTVQNVDTIKIKRNSSNLYNVRLKLQFPDIFGAMNAMSMINKSEGGDLHLHGDIKIQYLLVFSKSITINETQQVDLPR